MLREHLVYLKFDEAQQKVYNAIKMRKSRE